MKVERTELQRRQGWSLDEKVKWTLHQIRLWYEMNDGNVHVSFSGGKDSSVLLHLVRSLYPDVAAVFCNTGLEYPEIVQFVKSTDNVNIIRPVKSFRRVIKECGWPVVSKRVARYVWDLQRPPDAENKTTRRLRLTGMNRKGEFCPSMVLSKKWRFLVHAPFKVSAQCCDILKKAPFYVYQRRTGTLPLIGTMAEDSRDRTRQYMRTGCNSYDGADPMSRPLSIWTTEDIWRYIRGYTIPYSSIYDMGEKRTGCVFCPFGVHLEKEPNRFQRLQITHPKLWKYCMEKLGLRDVLIFIGVPWRWKSASSERKLQDVEVHTE